MKPSRKQRDAVNEKLHDFNIFSGVTGSGKSFVTNLLAFKTIFKHIKDGQLVLFSGNTAESLYDNVVKPILTIDPIGAFQYSNKTGSQRLFYNDGRKSVEISCVGANNERAQDRVQGKNVALWLADEITKQPKSFVEMALSRCRQVIDGTMRTSPVIWTCNPDHPEHFIKRDYIDNTEVDCKNWFFGFDDNPTIDQSYIDNVKRRYSGVFYDRMILGKWVSAEGSIFTEFTPSEHIIDTEPVIHEYYLGMDWGYNHPMALILVGVDRDGVYYALDEFYKSGQLVDKSLADILKAKGWHQLGAHKKPPVYCYGDSESPADCQSFRVHTGWSVVPVAKPAGSVIDGIKLMQGLMLKQGNGKSRVYVHRRCQNLIREMQSYKWRSKRGVEMDEPEKENDHSVDAFRYCLYMREAGKVRVLKESPFRR